MDLAQYESCSPETVNKLAHEGQGIRDQNFDIQSGAKLMVVTLRMVMRVP
jgi:hypothetical protein